MEEDPIQLENDELGCPRCKVELVEGKSSVYFQKVKVGSFDSMRCEFCGFFILTDTGFRESTKAITKLGLIEGEDYTGIEDTAIELFYPNVSDTQSVSISLKDEEEEETLVNTSIISKSKITTTPLLVTSNFKFLKK